MSVTKFSFRKDNIMNAEKIMKIFADTAYVARENRTKGGDWRA